MPYQENTNLSVSPIQRKSILREYLEAGTPYYQARLSIGNTEENNSNPFLESQYVNQGNPQEQLSQLDRGIRWHSFLFHSHFFHAELIKKIYGLNVTSDATEWRAARTKIIENTKSYKFRVLDAISSHIDMIYQQEETSHVRQIRDRRELQELFRSYYSINNFYFCWNYMARYVDLDRSSDLGKYYCSTIYINLCTEVKLWKDTIGTPTEDNVRRELLIFYDELPVAPIFDSVTEREFYHIVDRGRNERVRRRRDPGNRLLIDRFASFGDPPPGTGCHLPQLSPPPSFERMSQPNSEVIRDDHNAFSRVEGPRGGGFRRSSRSGRGTRDNVY